MRRHYLPILFFLSGISGLIYEVAWVRQASLTFGVSVYAYSAVLAAYMGGMALGSYLAGRYMNRIARPLQTFGALQAGIAVLGGLSPWLLSSLDGVYAAAAQALPQGTVLLTLLRLVLSMAALAPATLLLGATLPLLSRAYVGEDGHVGRDVGRLYAANTAGAVLGCLAAGVFLIRLLGLKETVLLGAALNLAVAGAALWAGRRAELAPAVGASPQPRATRRRRALQPVTPPGTPKRRLVLRFIGAGYALSGLVALGYEVVWARILAIHTLHAIYSFSLMLAVYLTGLAVGGALGTWWAGRRRVTLVTFGGLQMGIGALAVAALFVFTKLPALSPEGTLGGYDLTREMLFEILLALITLFPATLLIGAAFPVAGSLYTGEQKEGVGRRMGEISALNTLGAIAGSLLAGFLLIPLLGLRDTSLALSALNLGLGMVAIWLAGPEQEQARWLAAPALGAVVMAVLVMPPGLYLGFREGPSEYLVFYKEGVETTVAVFDVPQDDFKVSFVNGRIEVPTDAVSMTAFHLLGHLPALLRPGAQNALVLSFGNGIAAGSLDKHGIPTIDAVDLSAEMIAAADVYWQENDNVLHSPRLHLHVEDARNYLLQNNQQYDIISTDATHPSNSCSWALFTREFYTLVQQRLADDGVFVQWLPFHSLSEADYKSIIRTFQSVFPHATLWYAGGSHTFLVATPEELTPEVLQATLAQTANVPSVLEELGTPEQIPGYLAFDEDALAAYAGEGPIATDDNAFFLPGTDETAQIVQAIEAAMAGRD